MWLTEELKSVLKDFYITYDGQDLTDFFIPQSITGRDFQEHEFTWLDIPFRDGAIITSTRVLAQPLTITGLVACNSAEELRQTLEFLNEYLYRKNPVSMTFSDEFNREYFVWFQSAASEDLGEGWLKVTLNFARPDPYKYGSTWNVPFEDGMAIVDNQGTATAFPRYELTVTEAVTHVDIIGPAQFFRLGRPKAIDQTEYQHRELIASVPMTTLVGWATASEVDNGYVSGSIIATPTGFEVDTFGTTLTPEKFQGPALRRSVAALQNFEIELDVELRNTTAQTGMIELYLIDAAGNTVAKIGIEDRWTTLVRTQAKFQVGNEGSRAVDVRQTAKTESAWNDFKGVMRIMRSGQFIMPYFALVDEDGNHSWAFSQWVYTDSGNEYQSPIVEIKVAMRIFPDTDPAFMKTANLNIWRLNDEPEGVPIIANPGDKVVVDTATGEMTINGEELPGLRDFTADLFELNKGENMIVLSPSTKLEGTVQYRERFR